jgi:hypothetical protein
MNKLAEVLRVIRVNKLFSSLSICHMFKKNIYFRIKDWQRVHWN